MIINDWFLTLQKLKRNGEKMQSKEWKNRNHVGSLKSEAFVILKLLTLFWRIKKIFEGLEYIEESWI